MIRQNVQINEEEKKEEETLLLDNYFTMVGRTTSSFYLIVLHNSFLDLSSDLKTVSDQSRKMAENVQPFLINCLQSMLQPSPTHTSSFL